MLTKFQNTINSDFPKLAEYKVYLAISGGIDSMVLCDLLIKCNIEVQLLHCNFKLRKKESNEDQKFIENYAIQNKLKYQVKNFDTLAERKKRKKNIQETARDLRYEWFYEICLNFDNSIILTAHHLDDSIETFFINLLRGTGLKGVRGIPKKNTNIYRPLLKFSRKDIVTYASEQNIKYREDSSNLSDKYLRNDIRHNVLTELLRIEPNFHSKMSTFFEEMSEINELLESQSENFAQIHIKWKNSYFECEIIELLNLNEIILCRVFNKFGILRSNFSEFFKFLSSNSGKQFFTSSHEFVIHRDKLLFKELNSKPFREVVLHKETFLTKMQIEDVTIEKIELKSLPKKFDSLIIDFDRIQFPIKIRQWKNGDKITPYGKSSEKLISDVLINKKLSLFQKKNALIIEDYLSNIVVLIPYMINNSYKLEPNSKFALRISYSF